MNGLLFGLVLKVRVFGNRKCSMMLTKCFTDDCHRQAPVFDCFIETKFDRDPSFTRHPNLK